MHNFSKLILAALIALPMATQAFEYKFFEGTHKNRDVSIRRDKVHLLSHFRFRFENHDHHIKVISINPDRQRGRLRAYYFDKNGDDPYSWQAGFYQVDPGRVVERVASGTGKGALTIDVPPPSTNDHLLLLSGFYLRFNDGDHEIKQVSVMTTNNNKLYIGFHDRNWDDSFQYTIRYAWMPKAYFLNWGENKGEAKSFAVTSLPSQKFVLRSFKFFFKNGDHNLVNIGLDPAEYDAKDIFVDFRDNNGDDKYDWMFRWAIPRPTITTIAQPVSTLRGTIR